MVSVRRFMALCFWLSLLAAETLYAESVPKAQTLDANTQAFIDTQANAAAAVITAADRRDAERIATQARNIVNAALDQAQALPEANVPPDPELSIRIFISQSLPRADQAAAIALAQADARITLVFRGLLPETRLADFKRWLAELLGPFARLSRAPKIEIDPPAYHRAGIEIVPVVAIYRNGRLKSQVAGMLDPSWLEAELAAGRSGPYRARGPTHAIAEADLMAVMQAKARAFDWQAWQRQQRAALYRSLKAQALPKATASRLRWHDPSFVVQETIRAQPQVIAEAGTRINPLDTLPFTQELWVLDATDAGQWQLALQWQRARARQPTPARITVLTTALPETDSLAWLDARSRELGQPIQLWRDDFANAFGIAAVPTRLRAELGRFRVEEFHVPAATGVQHADRQTTP